MARGRRQREEWRLGRSDAVDPGGDAPRFAVTVRGDAPGDRVVRLHIRFGLSLAVRQELANMRGSRKCDEAVATRAAKLRLSLP